jgi:putative ABC transport system permease protein
MRLISLVVRNSARSPLRTSMTVLTVAIMLTAFVFPRTLVDSQEKQVREAPNNRVVVLSKLGWTVPLPARYADEIRTMPGIRRATSVRGAGLEVAGKENQWFGSNGVDPEPFIAMHHELVAPPEQKQAFLSDERSAMVSVDAARIHGWQLGDRVVFQSWVYPGDFEFTIRCIYEAIGGEWAKRSVYVHYAALNRQLSGDAKDKINLITAEILFVVLAILINTLMLNVRERTREFGVLRAIGFGPQHLYLFVLGEAAVLGAAGSVLGLALSYPLLEGLVGPYLQQNLDFPPTEIPLRVTLEVHEALGRVV